MHAIKSTPAFWIKIKNDFLEMVEHLIIPTFILTLSCVDSHCEELISISITNKINSLNMTDTDISNVNYQERCDTLNSNLNPIREHFQY